MHIKPIKPSQSKDVKRPGAEIKASQTCQYLSNKFIMVVLYRFLDNRKHLGTTRDIIKISITYES